MLRRGHGGLYKAPTNEERGRLRGEGDKIEFIDFRFETGQVPQKARLNSNLRLHWRDLGPN